MLALGSDLIPLNRVPDLLPPSPRTGRPMHVDTVKRWALSGVFGVKLEVARLPNSTYTSAEALGRFLDRVDAARGLAVEEVA